MSALEDMIDAINRAIEEEGAIETLRTLAGTTAVMTSVLAKEFRGTPFACVGRDITIHAKKGE